MQNLLFVVSCATVLLGSARNIRTSGVTHHDAHNLEQSEGADLSEVHISVPSPAVSGLTSDSEQRDDLDLDMDDLEEGDKEDDVYEFDGYDGYDVEEGTSDATDGLSKAQEKRRKRFRKNIIKVKNGKKKTKKQKAIKKEIKRRNKGSAN